MNNNQGRKRVRRARKNNANVKRILLTICMMALVAVVSIGGTIAWLTAETGTITNEFTTSTIGVELKETTDDYKMVPGVDIAKDPKVTLTEGSEAAWLFVTVEEKFTDVTVDDETYNFSDYLEYTVDSAWTELEDGVYYIKDPAAGQAYSVLTGDEVTVPDTVTKEMMGAISANNHPQLIFKAYTIQMEGFATAADAWAEVKPAAATNP